MADKTKPESLPDSLPDSLPFDERISPDSKNPAEHGLLTQDQVNDLTDLVDDFTKKLEAIGGPVAFSTMIRFKGVDAQFSVGNCGKRGMRKLLSAAVEQVLTEGQDIEFTFEEAPEPADTEH